MKIVLAGVVAGALALSVAAAQEAPPPAPKAPEAGNQQPGNQRGRAGWGGMMGRGMLGTVTEVTPDHFKIKNEAGEIRTINFSVNTRFMKQPAQRQSEGGERTPPQTIKATDIKVGDAIAASGEMDPSGNSVGAVLVVQLDPERARQMRDMQANFGKTWLIGKVLAIHETKVTVQSPIDNSAHTFVADENTTFRKRRDIATLADVQVGDNVRVEGTVKEGVFMATTVNVMGMPPARGGPMPPPGATPPQ
jgi:hypothetical protein